MNITQNLECELSYLEATINGQEGCWKDLPIDESIRCFVQWVNSLEEIFGKISTIDSFKVEAYNHTLKLTNLSIEHIEKVFTDFIVEVTTAEASRESDDNEEDEDSDAINPYDYIRNIPIQDKFTYWKSSAKDDQLLKAKQSLLNSLYNAKP